MNSGRIYGPNQGAFWRDQKAGATATGASRQETGDGHVQQEGSENRTSSRGLAEFSRLFRSMVDPYRPELHYMRGPGPKWHAKHTAVPAHEPVMHGLARIEG